MSGRVIVEGPAQTISPGGIGGAEAICPAGKKVVGGGYKSNSIAVKVFALVPFDREDGTSGYRVSVMSDASGPETYRAVATCVSAS